MSNDMEDVQSSLANGAENSKSDSDRSAVSIDLSCIKAEYAPGVSEPSTVYGFTDTQILNSIDQLIKCKKDDLFMVTGYNPAIEKFKTGELIVNIFKHLI